MASDSVSQVHTLKHPNVEYTFTYVSKSAQYADVKEVVLR